MPCHVPPGGGTDGHRMIDCELPGDTAHGGGAAPVDDVHAEHRRCERAEDEQRERSEYEHQPDEQHPRPGLVEGPGGEGLAGRLFGFEGIGFGQVRSRASRRSGSTIPSGMSRVEPESRGATRVTTGSGPIRRRAGSRATARTAACRSRRDGAPDRLGIGRMLGSPGGFVVHVSTVATTAGSHSASASSVADAAPQASAARGRPSRTARAAACSAASRAASHL